MDDRFTKGFFAGVFGGIAANTWSFFSGYIGFTSLRFVDWAAITIYGHIPPFSSGEILVALVSNIVFTGMLGVAFAYLVPQVTSENIFLKGWVFAMATWFVIYGISVLYKVPGVVPIPMWTVLSDMISASTFGLVQAYTLASLVNSRSFLVAPAMKPKDGGDKE